MSQPPQAESEQKGLRRWITAKNAQGHSISWQKIGFAVNAGKYVQQHLSISDEAITCFLNSHNSRCGTGLNGTADHEIFPYDALRYFLSNSSDGKVNPCLSAHLARLKAANIKTLAFENKNNLEYAKNCLNEIHKIPHLLVARVWRSLLMRQTHQSH